MNFLKNRNLIKPLYFINMKKTLFSFLTLLAAISFGQDDLLDEIESEATGAAFNTPAFKALKIGNLQSTKVAAQGDTYLYVSHRFGDISDGISTLFGLDFANTKIQLLHGFTDYLQLGVSRESIRQTYAGSAKLKLTDQTADFPVNITGYTTINMNTALRKEQYPNMLFFDRLSYGTQLLVSRSFSSKFSMELAPGFIRQNLVLEPFQLHNQYTLGIGGRYKLSDRVSINIDYVMNLSRAEESIYNDPLTIGIDLETGGHIFQLLFTNAQSSNEPGFISNTEGSWTEGTIYFGFNIARVF